ncbi:MAG: Na+/H+ antiporter NhaC family protein [Anaerovoracaceae bacterium]|jgi:tetracycline resistance efflux pump
MEVEVNYGIISLIPCVILITMALVTKRTFEPLVVGTLIALLISSREDWFVDFVGSALDVVARETWVILVVGLMGSFLFVLEKSKSTLSFAGLLSKFATSRRKALISEWFLSMCLFIDDYLNILTTGNTVKRITDRFKISRVQSAFILGSTSAPIVVLAPISTWAVFFSSLLANAGMVPEGGSAVGTYMSCVPYMFYPVINIIIVLLVIAGIFPLIGPMRKLDRKARETGDLYPDGLSAPVEVPESEEDKNAKQGTLIDFILPLAVLITVTLILDIDVLMGVTAALFFTAIFYVVKKLTTISQFVDNMWAGFNSMMTVLGLLVAAFMFKEACDDLGMAPYVISKVQPFMQSGFLPLVVFIISALMTFALANAWGLAAIMVPIVVPLAQGMDANIFLSVAAIFSGATLGTQACFYSDNAILIGQSFNIRPFDHAITQLPFALVAAVISAILYLVFGFTLS